MMSVEEGQRARLNILLVEDDPAHAELIIRSLEDHPLSNKIHHLADGEAALDYLFRRDPPGDSEATPRPHVILLDLRLPDTSGFEVCRALRAESIVPIIIITAQTDTHDMVAGLEHPAPRRLRSQRALGDQAHLPAVSPQEGGLHAGLPAPRGLQHDAFVFQQHGVAG